MDRIIHVKVRGPYMTKDNMVAGAQGEGNATYLEIDFAKDWINLSKIVTFRNAHGENPVKRLLTADMISYHNKNEYGDEYIGYKIPIPGEAMTDYGMMSFVIDGWTDGVRTHTVSDKLKVLESWSYVGEAVDLTPTEVEQLQVQIDYIIQKVDDAIRAGEKLESVLTLDEFVLLAQSYAVGGSGIRDGENTDNAKYYYELCLQIAAGNTIIMRDDATQELYKLGVDNGLLYVQSMGGDTYGPDSLPDMLPDSGNGGASEYIVSCSINANGELVLVTNTGRMLNAGEIPTGTSHCVVNITQNVEFSADKTYAEVVEAMEAGMVVSAKLQRADGTVAVYAPVTVDSSCVTFQRDYEGAESQRICLYSDGRVLSFSDRYSDLPKATEEDVGKILVVDDMGHWAAQDIKELTVTIDREAGTASHSASEIISRIDEGYDVVLHDLSDYGGKAELKNINTNEVSFARIQIGNTGVGEHFYHISEDKTFTEETVTYLTTAALDFSNWQSGSFKETLSDGSTVTHPVVFDADGVVTKVGDVTVSGVL